MILRRIGAIVYTYVYGVNGEANSVRDSTGHSRPPLGFRLRRIRLAIAAPLTAASLVGLSVLAGATDSGSVFPLLVVPVIVWGVLYGTRAGLVAAGAFSIHTLAFVYFALGHTQTVPYVMIAVFMFLAVGYVVGRLSDLQGELYSKQEQLEQTRAELERQLEENRTLLVEVHHRIKNNMTTVLNLLSLQATSAEVLEVASALHDASNRVRTMVILYDRLYRSEHHDSSAVGDYVESLGRAVLGTLSRSGRIRIRLDAEDLHLPAQTLSTVGIIVNELITNTVKHAFEPDEEGTIRVRVRREANRARIVYEDDGRGLPARIVDEERGGFGLMLVHALADQLGGTASFETADGTRVTLVFPVPDA